MSRLVTKIVCTLFIAVVLAPRANAEIIHAFDPAIGEFPESVATDRWGDVYVSLIGGAGEIRRFTRDGEMESFFQLDPPPPPDSQGILGLTTDGGGRIYAAVASFDPRTHGVWRIGRTGNGFRIPGTEAIVFPNDLVMDRLGFLYVTDTAQGAVWRIGHNNGFGRPVELWAQDPLLLGDGSAGRPVPLGANGIALGQQNLYVAVTEGARVVSIEIEPGPVRAAGEISVHVEHPDLFLIDGITTDRDGRLFGAVVSLNGMALGRIMRIEPDAAPQPILGPEDGLQLPTNLTFGTRGRDRNKLYVANWDAAAGELGLTPMPALHAFELEARGRPAMCPAP